LFQRAAVSVVFHRKRRIAVGIEQYDCKARKAQLDDLDQFLSVKIGKPGVDLSPLARPSEPRRQ